jgi:hypothetical protein
MCAASVTSPHADRAYSYENDELLFHQGRGHPEGPHPSMIACTNWQQGPLVDKTAMEAR